MHPHNVKISATDLCKTYREESAIALEYGNLAIVTLFRVALSILFLIIQLAEYLEIKEEK